MKNRDRYEGSPKSFRIRADNIPVGGLDISENLTASFITKLIQEPYGNISWKAVSDAQFACRLEHEADMLHLKGGATFRVVYPCVRCMEDVEFELNVNFNIRLLPRDKDPDQGQTEFETESFEDVSALSTSDSNDESVASYYDDGMIDLSDLLREQLFLEFPQYPGCGSSEAFELKECDLSALESTNSQAATIIEHPFARLKDWKAHSVN